jgi:hypothetical protein
MHVRVCGLSQLIEFLCSHGAFFQYELQVDIHETRRRHAPEYEAQTFYGQLQHVYSIRVNPSNCLGIRRAETVVLAVILKCPVESDDPNGLDIHYHSQASGMDAVDMDTVQCMVGRVWSKVMKQWAVIDCSSRLARVQWDEDED